MEKCIIPMHIMTSLMTITIHNFRERALSSMISIINDVIMCSNIIHFLVILFLNINFIYPVTI